MRLYPHETLLKHSTYAHTDTFAAVSLEKSSEISVLELNPNFHTYRLTDFEVCSLLSLQGLRVVPLSNC